MHALSQPELPSDDKPFVDPDLPLSAAVMFGVACAALIIEVALTRVFSFLYWHQMTYLVISLALLGYGAAGSFLSIRPRLTETDYAHSVGRFCVLFSLLTVVSVPVVVWFPRDIEALVGNYYLQLLLVSVTHLLLAVPFFFAGAALGFVLMRNPRQTNRLYFADLFGAGLGSFLTVLIINRLGSMSAIFVAATIPAALALLAAWKDRQAPRLTHATLLLLMLGLSFMSAGREVIPLRVSRAKYLAGMERLITYTRWNVVSRVDVTAPRSVREHFGGRLSNVYRGPYPVTLPVFQDGGAPTAILNITGRAQDYPFLGDYLQGAPYALRPKPATVLVIGFGGGIDLLIAEYAGAQQVTGVDVNPVMKELLTRRYRDVTSALFNTGDVRLVVAEGRHYLTRTADKYDVIQLSGVDTYAAIASGSLALTENYLYTREAVKELLHHLKDGGVLSFSRYYVSSFPEALRLVVTASATLREIGVQEPAGNFLVVGAGVAPYYWADTVIKATPFTPQEIETFRGWARDRQFEILFDPSKPAANPFNTYLRSAPIQQEAFLRSFPLDISPSRDDHPFFFFWGLHGSERTYLMLLFTAGELLLCSILFVLVPLRRSHGFGLTGRQSLSLLTGFAGLGFGFIGVEIVLIQKLTVFLGGPAYSMAITLFALLAFSGLGSQLSRRLSTARRAALAAMIGVLLVVQVAELAFLNKGVPALLGLNHFWRCLAGVLAIAPLGLFMGMPFPALLSKAGKHSPVLIPWAWGINACATVVGAVIITIVSLALGFNLAWVFAMCMYGVVLAVVAIALPGERGPRAVNVGP